MNAPGNGLTSTLLCLMQPLSETDRARAFDPATRIARPLAFHACTNIRVSAKSKPRSHSAGLLRSKRQLLANPPFNDSDTALRGSAFLRTGGKLQVMPERQDNFRKDDDVRWQPSGARQIAKGNPQGERGGVHPFGVPPKTALRGSALQKSECTPQVASEARDNNTNFARVQHFIHHLAS